MNKKKLALLVALGFITDKEASAFTEAKMYFDGKNPNNIAESLQTHPNTIRFLKILSQMEALKFEKEKVVIHPDHLPEVLIEQLHESSETEFDEETGSFVLKETFINALATNHTFSRLGTYSSIKANQDILSKLKEKANPVLREDLVFYSVQAFRPDCDEIL